MGPAKDQASGMEPRRTLRALSSAFRKTHFLCAFSALCGSLPLTLASPELHASIGDVFGFGPRGSAMNAQTAVADDYSASWYNPAGLHALSRPRTSFGFTGVWSGLSINGERREIEDPHGIFFGASAPVPFGGFLKDRLWVGVGLYLPWLDLVKAVGPAPDEAFFPLYDNRTQRLVALPTMAVRILPNLAIGASINYLARLDGTVISHEGAARGLEADVNEHLAATASPIVGIRYDPIPEVSTGLAWRGEFRLPFRTATNNHVSGNLLILDIDATTLYSPHQISAAAAYRPIPDLTLALDFTWKFWSRYDGPFINVKVEMPDVLGVIEPGVPAVPFDDTFNLAAGGEYHLALPAGHDLFVRAGVGIEPSPLGTQEGPTNLLDGFKTMLSAGAGWATELEEKRRLAVDVHCQVQIVSEMTVDKTPGVLTDEDPATPGLQTSNPGYPTVSGGGSILSLGAGVSLTY